MKRLIVPLAIGMAVLYAALAIGAGNCLVLHAEQPTSHPHTHSHVTHSALCAWACQIHPTVTLPAGVPLIAVSMVVARLCWTDASVHLVLSTSETPSRAPPR